MSDIQVPISIGELLDKITILRIKQKNISDKNKLSHIEKELTALLSVCSSNNIDADHSLVGKLQNINQQLWHIEDQIREKERRKEFDDEFVEIARAVYFRNDERFKVKSEINQAFGSSFQEEKSYEDYS